MTLISRFTTTFAMVLLPLVALAGEPRQIGWVDLAPPAVEIENPFESLTPGQMDRLRLILRLESPSDPRDDTKAEAQQLRAGLAGEGIDVNALFRARLDIIAKREAAATQVNDDIVGKTIRMPGYLLALTLEGRKATEFLLVPTLGACIHTPPPAANQIVHVVYPGGIEVEGLFTPVWITGALTAEPALRTVGLSDGQAAVPVSYTMQADAVSKYSQ